MPGRARLRNLFHWRSSKESQTSGTSGWKLFGGRVPPRGIPSKDPPPAEDTISQGQESEPGSPTSLSKHKRNSEIVASSTALILENRPANLPAKSHLEEQKHRQEYEQMVEAARKKELKEAKLRKKQLQQQLKLEEQLANAARIWNNEILPKWDSMKNSRKTRELWWQGIPPSVRGKVWKLAIGNDLNITHELYEICVARAKDRIRLAAESASLSEVLDSDENSEKDNPDKEGSVELIKLDVSRTFPHLCIFQKGGPYYDMLHSLLGAYVCYRPDVGYVQGMSFLAAVLILNLEVADAFVSFANLLNRPCHMAFFRLDEPLMNAYYDTYNDFFRENLPRLWDHFQQQNLTPDLYLLDWVYTIFSKSMPLDIACRMWDVFFRDGEEFLFRAALGVLHLYEDILLNLDFIHSAQFLSKLPDDISPDNLLKSIQSVKMVVEKQTFQHMLMTHLEAAKEPS